MIATIKAYLWVAPYVLIGLLIAVVFYYKSATTTAQSKNIKLSSELALITKTAQDQKETINSLIQLNAAKDKIVADISHNVASINDNTIKLGKDINTLKESNTDVKALLDTSIPADLNRLLNQ